MSTSIGDALFTKTQQQVLGLLYANPNKAFYSNEIVRLAGMGRGTVRRELERLTDAGLLVVSRAGNQLHYQVNQNSPVYAELYGLVVKTFGVVDVLREALEPLAESIVAAFVFGSVARGQETASSDIDLMLIGSVSFEEVVSAVYPCHSMLGREINPSVYSISEFAQKIKEKNSFITQVMEQPKLMILGREDDIRKFGQDQQTQVT